jgi:AbrB family looped-hinge helix DNA binding protein
MQQVKFIKSFSKGQITIPKEIRKLLGVEDEFWMKAYVDNGKLIVEPVTTTVKPKISNEEYLRKLLSLKTDWFTKEVEEDYKKVREEIEEHVEKNSI